MEMRFLNKAVQGMIECCGHSHAGVNAVLCSLAWDSPSECPHLKCYSPWLNVQVETSNKWCPSRVHTGTSTIK